MARSAANARVGLLDRRREPAIGTWLPTGATARVPTSATAVSIATSGATVTIAPGETESAGSLTIAAGATLSMPGESMPPIRRRTGSSIRISSRPSLPTARRRPTWWHWGSSVLSQHPICLHRIAIARLERGEFHGRRAVRGNARQFVHDIGLRDDPESADRQRDGLLEFAVLQLVVQPDQLTTPRRIRLPFSPPPARRAARWPAAWAIRGGTISIRRPSRRRAPPTLRRRSKPTAARRAPRSTSTISQLGPTPAGAKALPRSLPRSISNSGTLTVGPTNTVTISGTFTQTSTGTLDVQLGGAPVHGKFRLRQRIGGRDAGRHAQGGHRQRLLALRRPTPSLPSSSPAKRGASPAKRCPAVRDTSSTPPSPSRTS